MDTASKKLAWKRITYTCALVKSIFLSVARHGQTGAANAFAKAKHNTKHIEANTMASAFYGVLD